MLQAARISRAGNGRSEQQFQQAALRGMENHARKRHQVTPLRVADGINRQRIYTAAVERARGALEGQLQVLYVRMTLLVEQHYIYIQPLDAQILLRAQTLLDEDQIVLALAADQKDWTVAGDGQPPQMGNVDRIRSGCIAAG